MDLPQQPTHVHARVQGREKKMVRQSPEDQGYNASGVHDDRTHYAPLEGH